MVLLLVHEEVQRPVRRQAEAVDSRQRPTIDGKEQRQRNISGGRPLHTHREPGRPAELPYRRTTAHGQPDRQTKVPAESADLVVGDAQLKRCPQKLSLMIHA
ncbi:hypothetical protein OG345_26320 [Streptomyces sp. NBC_01220]|uniref:hypothetical protein n=1 Tax=unclassified Streptomyces TaxID=2593676 RepID=UPI002E32FAFC|nr:hypothetical protein [Streptomyces sp. NBC_01358]WSQ49242.1 hypothetical protein OG345_26320 [Streptomyces sp. NBC_01220]